MSEKIQIKITKEEFEKGIIPYNYVAVQLLRAEKDAHSKGGLYVGFLEDITWGDWEGVDGDTHPADVASVVGKVVRLPNQLYFKKGDQSSMLWETEMEIELDDIVWFNHIESLNTNEIVLDNKIIRFIPYADIYVAKRERWLSKFDNKKTTDIICLNGYCLLEQVQLPKLSKYDLLSKGVHDDRGIVRYMGKANKRYYDNKYTDNTDINIGDLVFFTPGYQPFLLERKGYTALFDGNKLFWCVQRRRLILTL